MNARPRSARQEIDSELARCTALDRQIERSRLTLRRECERERRALRRVATRVELAEHRGARRFH